MSTKDVEQQTAAAEEEALAEEAMVEGEAAAVAAALRVQGEVSKTTAAEGSRAAREAAKREKKESAAALAVLEKEMPKVAGILKGLSGFTPEVRASWLERLKVGALTEEEIVALVVPVRVEAKARKRTLNEHVIVLKHGLKRWLRSQNVLWRLLYVTSWSYVVIQAVVISFLAKHVWTIAAIVGALGIVIAKIRLMIRDIRPKNMQIIDRGYNERKVQLQQVIEASQRWRETAPTAPELERYRRDALTLVASYVRDHRARYGSREILANLLTRDGDGFVVIARSDGLRPVPQRYTREQVALVAQCIETGEPKITGDLYADFPNTVDGKKYRSILVLPVWFRGRVVGVVSVDSQERYHFHFDFEDLQIHLLPYVQLLAVGL